MAAHSSRVPPRLILTIAAVLLTVLVVHLAGVALLRYFVEKELHPALPKGTYIGDVHLNLFSGALEIDGFELRNAGDVRMRFAELVVQVSPWRLLSGAVRVERAELRQGYMRVDRREDGSFDLGLPDFAGDAPAEPAGGPPPDVTIDGVTIDRLTVDYRDGELASELYVDNLEVGTYSLRADAQRLPVDWSLRWDGRQIDGNAVVDLQADAEPAASGSLRTGLLDLGRAERLARLPNSVRGEVGYQGEFSWRDGKLALAGDLRAPQIEYAIANRRVALGELVFPGFRLDLATRPQLSVQFAPGADSRLASWDTVFDGQAVNGGGLGVRGVFSYDGAAVAVRDLLLTADAVGWQDAGRRVQLAGLAVDGRAEQRLSGDTPFPALNANLGAESVVFEDSAAALQVDLKALRLSDLAISQPDAERQRRLGGRLTLAGSAVTQADTALRWQAVDATLAGQLAAEAVALTTDTRVSGLSVGHPQLVHGPLQIGQVIASGLALGDQVAFDGLRLEALELPAEPADTSLKVGSIAIAASHYSAQSGVDVGQIDIDALQTAVIRNKSGVWRYPMAPADAADASRAPAAGEGAAPAAVETDAAGGADLAWRLAGLRVGGESYLQAADQLNPDMTAPRFKIDKLQIGALASDAPGRDTPFDIVLRPDQYSEFVIAGKVRPLADELFLDAEGHLHGFAMQAFNGLVANDLGHRFTDGQLDNDFAIRIEKNHLTMGNKLALATVAAEELEGKDGPPLGTAIALLEDRDGNIKLEVPVEGDLTDPQFRVLGALNPIIMKAVAGTAALAIQPLGSVLLVGSLLADQALKVTFQPALFAPGSAELDSAAKKYLAQLAGKLAEKPKLAVRICGVAVDAERKRDNKGNYLDKPEDLLAVAQRRADAARSHLAANGAGAKQLRRCRPALDAKPEAEPRVDIKF